MAYIGKEPIVGNFQKCDAISVVNGQAAYTLQVSSTNVVPESANHVLVSLNGILQAPVTSFTVSGSTLTFASNLATGDVIDFVILLGNVLDLGTPSDGTVTNAKLASDLISGETDIGGAIADADLFLLDDGAGGTLRKTAASRIKTYVGGGISMAQTFRLTADTSGTQNPISSNLEAVDTDSGGAIGSAMSESSGIFTFPSTGIYFISAFASALYTGSIRYCRLDLEVTTDNSSYSAAAQSYGHINNVSSSTFTNMGACNFIFDVTNTSTHKARLVFTPDNESASVRGNTDHNSTAITFIRLGDT